MGEVKKEESGLILTDNSVSLSVEIREQITKKIEEIRQRTNNKRIQAIVVKGDECDDKPLYVGYFRRPNLMQFSLWLNQIQKDSVIANRTLAQGCFVDGDKELVDNDDLFLFGTFNKLTALVESRNADLVKLSSAAK